jgi:hypothetical protein
MANLFILNCLYINKLTSMRASMALLTDRIPRHLVRWHGFLDFSLAFHQAVRSQYTVLL